VAQPVALANAALVGRDDLVHARSTTSAACRIDEDGAATPCSGMPIQGGGDTTGAADEPPVTTDDAGVIVHPTTSKSSRNKARIGLPPSGGSSDHLVQGRARA